GDQPVPDAVRGGHLGPVRRVGRRPGPDEPVDDRPVDRGHPPPLPTTQCCVSHGSSSPCPADVTGQPFGAAHSPGRPPTTAHISCRVAGPSRSAGPPRLLPAVGRCLGAGRVLPSRTRFTRSGDRVPFYAGCIVGGAPTRGGNRPPGARPRTGPRPGACVARVVPGGRVTRRPRPPGRPAFGVIRS